MAVRGSPSVWDAGHEVVAGTDHLPDVADPTPSSHLEQVQVLALGRVVADGGVAPRELHVADLALAGVAEGAVGFPAVLVAVLLAGLPRKEEDGRMA